MKKREYKLSGEKIFEIVNIFVLSLLLVIVLYPLYFIVIASFSDPSAVNTGNVWLFPKGASLEGYRRIFADNQIWSGYGNTVFYTVTGTLLNVVITMMIAYPLSRKTFRFRGIIMVYLLITMYFNGGLIPTFLTVQGLGLENTRAVMILMGAVNVFNVIIARSFIENNIPDELFEAATIDGCSHFKFFCSFVLPLSKAGLAVLTLYYGISHWNEYMNALLYLRDSKLYSLQLILRSILIENQMQESMVADMSSMLERAQAAELIKYGIVVVSSLPVLMIYPFLQKYFTKGTMIGSVKG